VKVYFFSVVIRTAFIVFFYDFFNLFVRPEKGIVLVDSVLTFFERDTRDDC
jgi:hypothetical protein